MRFVLKALNKFFEFSGAKNKRKFYLSIVLGVALAFLEALRIPASFVMIIMLLSFGRLSAQ